MSLHSSAVTESPLDGSTFTVRVDLAAGRLHLAGHLNRRTVHVFDDAIATLQLIGCHNWVVDVADLSACDYAGVRAISAAYRRALRRNRGMTLIGESASLRWHLQRLRLDHHIYNLNRETTKPRAIVASNVVRPKEA
jgi:anti-anti-sigma regulatory factor